MAKTDTNIRVELVKTNKSLLGETEITNGCVWFVDDTKELFFDFDSKRSEVKDILVLQQEAERTSILFAPLNKFYFVLETQVLWFYKDGSWYKVSPDLSVFYTKEEINELISELLKFKNITYSELVYLKTNNQLEAGTLYRITDYVTTTNGNSANSAEPSRSTGHPFDIIVQALGPSDLSEICSCVLHEGDTYFANQNLGAWKVWYDINNDTSKYAWAVTDGTGKGVIYRMIDEYQNDFPYDFKNIQFYRDKTLSKYSTIKSGMKAEDGYYYTVSDTSGTNISDLSLLYGYVRDNQMGAHISDGRVLNNNVSIQNTSRNFTHNIFQTSCYNNTFGYQINYNNFGSFFYDNVVGNFFQGNRFNARVYNNLIANNFYFNNISTNFYNNIIKGQYFEDCNIGENCHDNKFIGTHYAPFECNFGGGFCFNTVGDDISGIIFENSIRYLNIPAGLYQATIKSKLRGSSATNLLDLTGLTTYANYNQTVEKDINGRVLVTYSDLGVTKGKYKESVTATDWNDIVPEYYTKSEVDTKIGDISSLLDSINGEA